MKKTTTTHGKPTRKRGLKFVIFNTIAVENIQAVLMGENVKTI
jgi:hypothetical protein